MAKQNKKIVTSQTQVNSTPQTTSTWTTTSTTPQHSVAIGMNQVVDGSFQCKIGNGADYQETFDMRSMFLIIKTLLKESKYDESLIYMRYDELEPFLNRESVINEILNSKDE